MHPVHNSRGADPGGEGGWIGWLATPHFVSFLKVNGILGGLVNKLNLQII